MKSLVKRIPLALVLALTILLSSCTETAPISSESGGNESVSSSITLSLNLSSNEEIESKVTESVFSSSSKSQTVTSKDSQTVTSKDSQTATSSKAPQKKPSSTTIPAYSGKPYVTINNNQPVFSKSELTTNAYEKYSELDSLGRTGVAIASLGKETMPAEGEKRGSISSIYPTGWVQAEYSAVPGKYLYNRSHLIGWQLSAENANKKNLLTGTKYLNSSGMLPFENMVADYINETGNHVAYRVTPHFSGKNLLCSGVQIEAYSVEDNGEGICFNVYCYNVQPNIKLDYATGKSQSLIAEPSSSKVSATVPGGVAYVLNTNSKKFHYPDCSSAKKISDKNRAESTKSRDQLISDGYVPCLNCDP